MEWHSALLATKKLTPPMSPPAFPVSCNNERHKARASTRAMPHMAHECHASYGKRHRGTSMLEVDASNASVAHQGTTTHAGISARATLWVREPDTRPTLPRIRAATSAPVSAEIVLGTPALGKRAAAWGGMAML